MSNCKKSYFHLSVSCYCSSVVSWMRKWLKKHECCSESWVPFFLLFCKWWLSSICILAIEAVSLLIYCNSTLKGRKDAITFWRVWGVVFFKKLLSKNIWHYMSRLSHFILNSLRCHPFIPLFCPPEDSWIRGLNFFNLLNCCFFFFF